jgi:phage baseplate assembly protein W
MSTRAERERATYGFGLALDDGDLVLSDGRLAETYGLATLRQDLRTLLATPLAGDRLDVRYGLDVRDALTTALPRHLVKEVLRMSIVRTVSTDPRVSTIERVLFDDDPEYLVAHPGAEADPAARSALVEIVLTPVPLLLSVSEPASITDTRVQVLADVRW